MAFDTEIFLTAVSSALVSSGVFSFLFKLLSDKKLDDFDFKATGPLITTLVSPSQRNCNTKKTFSKKIVVEFRNR